RGHGQVLPRPGGGRDPLHAAVLGHGVPRRRRDPVDRADPLAQGDDLSPAGGGVAGGDGPALPQQRLGPAAARHARRPPALPVPPHAADVGRHHRGAAETGRSVVSVDTARRIADTVLYEGYILYPYRASHGKNASGVRWQFGVLVPKRHAEAHPLPAGALPAAGTVSGAIETWCQQTECIVEPGEGASIDVRLRFLHLQARQVERATEDGSFVPVESLTAGGRRHVTWDEGTETEVPFTVALDDVLGGERSVAVDRPAGEEIEKLEGGRVTRRREALSLRLAVSAEPLPGPYGIVRLRVRTENVADWAGDPVRRDEVLRHSAVATHLILGASPGTRFVSPLDPPEWA